MTQENIVKELQLLIITELQGYTKEGYLYINPFYEQTLEELIKNETHIKKEWPHIFAHFVASWCLYHNDNLKDIPLSQIKNEITKVPIMPLYNELKEWRNLC